MIEALVALAVMTVSLLAIGSVMAATARGVWQLESHVALVQVANNTLWRGLPARAELAEGEFSGRVADFDWRARIEPMVDLIEPSTGDAPWLPELIRLQVRSPTGAMIEVETLRLVKRGAR